MTDTVALAVHATSDVDAVTKGFDAIGDGAKAMANDVKSAGADLDTAASRIDGVASSAENLDDKSGKATGALGALSSGFELVGAEKYAGALQGAALATDFASGVGQALNLVLGLESVQRAKAAVQAGVHTVATTAQNVATKAAAAGQWALNSALLANPVGLVVVAIAALVAGFVLAYNKSETFRNIVQTVGAVGREAIGWVVDKIGDLVGYIKDKAEPTISFIGAAFDGTKKIAVDAINAIASPIEYVIGKVQDLIGWIKEIKVPDAVMKVISKLPGGGGGGVSGLQLAGGGGAMTPAQVINLYVTAPPGMVDLSAFVQLLLNAFRQQGIAIGAPA